MAATKNTKVIFTNSDGWMEMPPTVRDSCAPKLSFPATQTSSSTDSPAAA